MKQYAEFLSLLFIGMSFIAFVNNECAILFYVSYIASKKALE